MNNQRCPNCKRYFSVSGFYDHEPHCSNEAAKVAEQPDECREVLRDLVLAIEAMADAKVKVPAALWFKVSAALFPAQDILKRQPERESVSYAELRRIKSEMLMIYENRNYAPNFR